MLEYAISAGVATVAVWVLARLGRNDARIRRDASLGAGAGRDPVATGEGRVSVLVPARDEGRNIERCVASLRSIRHPDLDIVVLDDHSSDGTAELARKAAGDDPRVRVLAGTPLPDGWTGKAHALDQLRQAATGRWLLFTDADTEHHPGGLATALGYMREHDLRLLSALGVGLSLGFWERTFTPVWSWMLLFFLDPKALADPAVPRYFACGQFVLIDTATYDQLGGFAAVRDDIVEDCALMARAQQGGVRCRMLLRTDLFRVRMYRNLAEIREGWGKNAYPALAKLGRGPLAAAATVFAVLLLTVVPLAFGPLAIAAASLVALALRAVSGMQPLYFWTLPLGGLLSAAILANSLLRTLAGKTVAWKGRRYVPRASIRR